MNNLSNDLLKYISTASPVRQYLVDEQNRQEKTIELIASENFCSDAVRACMASCLTNKYAEGYPVIRSSGNCGRYYGGCENIDKLEEYCCNKWREVFNTDYHVNVQPHSGSQANFAAYQAVLNPGDTILSLSLNNGGHLTHGSSVNFSGKIYHTLFYGLTEDGRINYTELDNIIRQHKPNLVLVGASAYSREIDFKKIYDIIEKNSFKTAYEDQYSGIINEYTYRPVFMVDMAHIAGLVAAGEHQSPFGLADIITTTTHKTLRGPRGGLIFCKPELAKKIDSSIFPGSQGGPLEHVIAAKAVCAEEACSESFKNYIHQVVLNSKAMANKFVKAGFKVVTDGTDNHMFLLDFSDTHPNITGKDIQEELDRHGITLNKNCIPNEKRPAKQTSGIRIGTAAMTTKGWVEQDFINCADTIINIINNMENSACKK